MITTATQVSGYNHILNNQNTYQFLEKIQDSKIEKMQTKLCKLHNQIDYSTYNGTYQLSRYRIAVCIASLLNLSEEALIKGGTSFELSLNPSNKTIFHKALDQRTFSYFATPSYAESKKILGLEIKAYQKLHEIVHYVLEKYFDIKAQETPSKWRWKDCTQEKVRNNKDKCILIRNIILPKTVGRVVFSKIVK